MRKDKLIYIILLTFTLLFLSILHAYGENVGNFENGSGGSLTAGKVVIWLDDADEDTQRAINTTTSAYNTKAIGVVRTTIANTETGVVSLSGICDTVNVADSTTVGDYLYASTTAGSATSQSSLVDGAFGIALTQTAGAGTVKALLWGYVYNSADGLVTTIKSNTDITFQIDADDDGTNYFLFQDGAGNNEGILDESGNFSLRGSILFDPYTAGAGHGITFRTGQVGNQYVDIVVKGQVTPASPDGLQYNASDGHEFTTDGGTVKLIIQPTAISDDITILGDSILGFDWTASTLRECEIRLRSGLAPDAAGGVGLVAIDHSGSHADGLAICGGDGISFYLNSVLAALVKTNCDWEFETDILPDTDDTGNIGTAAKTWATVRATDITVDDDLDVGGDFAVGGGEVICSATTSFRANTSDGSDNLRLLLGGGGDISVNRGGYIYISGNEYGSGLDGRVVLASGNSTNSGIFFYGQTTFDNDIIVDGGSIGLTADPDLLEIATESVIINGDLEVSGDVIVDGGSIGLTADPDLIEIASDSITLNGDVILENTQTFTRGVYVVSQVVNHDDSSPVAICGVVDGCCITDVYYEVTEAWDGDGTISIGDSTNNSGFMSTGDTNPSAGDWEGIDVGERGSYLEVVIAAGNNSDRRHIYSGADTINAYLVPGTSTQGQGVVYVVIQKLK